MLARGGAGPRGIGAEVLVDQLAHRLLVDVADHDQRRVVRLVVGVVEALAVGGRHLLEILDGADRRPVVGVLGVGERAEPLDRLADRIVVDAEALLLLDDLALGVDRRREELEVPHPLGLELQREADVRRRHGVVVGGQVLGGEGVDLAADLLEQPRVLLGRHVRRALEHHVLEHVRDAADADVLVLRSRRDKRPAPSRWAPCGRRGTAPRGRCRSLQLLTSSLGAATDAAVAGAALAGLAARGIGAESEHDPGQRRRESAARDVDSKAAHGGPDYDTLCRAMSVVIETVESRALVGNPAR